MWRQVPESAAHVFTVASNTQSSVTTPYASCFQHVEYFQNAKTGSGGVNITPKSSAFFAGYAMDSGSLKEVAWQEIGNWVLIYVLLAKGTIYIHIILVGNGKSSFYQFAFGRNYSTRGDPRSSLMTPS
ncbi:hypothetical protein Ccrd_002724 [Cynara cardunculus var. scolymus]|uniref:Uncharacterized protein n=1 Tax=Cynara cardunculus var. scolymus TaxID=59895 RepID=A0A124SCY2_CYNCS|nr:hypothetical protein Ccrd_002724 [Cynara cardunculus var. scolymus]